MLIIITVREGRPKPTPAKQMTSSPVPYIACATWDGQSFEARSTHGASMALARQLVAAGCPDQPWATHGPDGALRYSGPSLHRLATLTVSEGRLPTIVAWKPYSGAHGSPNYGAVALAAGVARVSEAPA